MMRKKLNSKEVVAGSAKQYKSGVNVENVNIC